MTIFKRIKINLVAERQRIAESGYNQRQRRALLKLVDLFEKGDWQKCLNHLRDEKAFPYNSKGEYSEREHIGIEMSRILEEVGEDTFYTKAEIINEALSGGFQ